MSVCIPWQRKSACMCTHVSMFVQLQHGFGIGEEMWHIVKVYACTSVRICACAWNIDLVLSMELCKKCLLIT